MVECGNESTRSFIPFPPRRVFLSGTGGQLAISCEVASVLQGQRALARQHRFCRVGRDNVDLGQTEGVISALTLWKRVKGERSGNSLNLSQRQDRSDRPGLVAGEAFKCASPPARWPLCARAIQTARQHTFRQCARHLDLRIRSAALRRGACGVHSCVPSPSGSH